MHFLNVRRERVSMKANDRGRVFISKSEHVSRTTNKLVLRHPLPSRRRLLFDNFGIKLQVHLLQRRGSFHGQANMDEANKWTNDGSDKEENIFLCYFLFGHSIWSSRWSSSSGYFIITEICVNPLHPCVLLRTICTLFLSSLADHHILQLINY